MNKFDLYISFYELVVYGGLILASISSLNIYLGALLLLVFSKQIPEKLLKNAPFLKGTELNRRPDCAENCRIDGGGGSFKDKPGFPSGHCAFASFLLFYMLFQYIRINNEECQSESGGGNIYFLLLVTLFFAIAMLYVRIHNNCHTETQAIAGFILGGVWAALMFYVVEELILIKNDRFVKDREKTFAYFKVSI